MHGSYCVQITYTVSHSFSVKTSLQTAFKVADNCHLLTELIFQCLLCSYSGHHLQKPLNSLNLKKYHLLPLSSMNCVGCATSLHFMNYTSSALIEL